jgi:hypothetical protein
VEAEAPRSEDLELFLFVEDVVVEDLRSISRRSSTRSMKASSSLDGAVFGWDWANAGVAASTARRALATDSRRNMNLRNRLGWLFFRRPAGRGSS